MFNIVLFEPEIPPNTGNIMRLAANTGAKLHLIEPLGFTLDNKQLTRAGLDYAEWADVSVYENFDRFLEKNNPENIYACSTKGKNNYSSVVFKSGDYLLFGPETRGLPDALLESLPKEKIIRIPMLPKSRSLNLSNAAAIILYEAWRQINFQI